MSDLIVIDATPREQKLIDEIERLTSEKSEAIQAFAAEVRKNVALQARVATLEALVEAYDDDELGTVAVLRAKLAATEQEETDGDN